MLHWTIAMGSGSGAEGGTAGMIMMAIWLAVCLTVVAGMWKVFAKAGQPGWGVLVPIYNMYLMCKIAQRPGWWLILLFIPVVNLVVAIVMSMDIAKHFGKGAGFGLGLAFLGFIFYPVLGFSGAQYGGGHMSHAMPHDMGTSMTGGADDQQQAA